MCWALDQTQIWTGRNTDRIEEDFATRLEMYPYVLRGPLEHGKNDRSTSG